MIFTRHGRFLAVCSLVFLCTCAALWAALSAYRTPSDLADCVIDAGSGGLSMSTACLKTVIPKLLKMQSAVTLLGYVNATSSPRAIHANCHGISHLVGAYEYAKEGEVPPALSQCPNGCAQGCLHGVVIAAMQSQSDPSAAEDAVHDLDALKRAAKKYCESPDLCHAIGHLLYDDLQSLDAALRGCDDESSGASAEQCYEGVFMQSLGGDGGIGFAVPAQPAAASSTDDGYPCDGVASRYRLACFKYLPAYAQARFQASGITSEEAMIRSERAACQRYDGTERNRCIYGIGLYGAARIFLKEPYAIAGFCSRFDQGDERSACTVGVSAGYMQSDRAADALRQCALSIDPSVQRDCYGSLFTRANPAIGTACAAQDLRASCAPARQRYELDPSAASKRTQQLFGMDM